MAKTPPKKTSAKPAPKKPVTSRPAAPSYALLPFASFRIQAIVLVLLGLICYGNSITNRYALDDGIVMERNEYVHKGFAGFGDIMTKDAYDSFYRQMNAKDQLKGGRFRPLSILTFAMEYEFLGFKKGQQVSFTNNAGEHIKGQVEKFQPSGEVMVQYIDTAGQKITLPVALDRIDQFSRITVVQHTLNVLLYIASVILLLYFLSYYLLSGVKYGGAIAFVTALLFLLHPLHTEVVANIKSRDEILSFLFIVATLIYAYRLSEGVTPARIFLFMSSFFLALLAKEYAAILILFIPMALWVSGKLNRRTVWPVLLPLMGVVLLYIPLRMQATVFHVAQDVQKDVLNDPYLFAKPGEVLPTKISILVEYIKLLLVPYPLASDYAYQHFPYRSFGSPMVWISLLAHLALVGLTVRALVRRHWLFFAGAFYLANLALVGNVLIDIGATMGERLIYHSSLGFCLLLAFLLVQAALYFRNEKTASRVLLTLAGLIGAGYMLIAIPRNAQWRDDTTLFLHDVKVHPNSAMLNGNAGSRLLNLSELPQNKDKADSLLQESVKYSRKAIELHPRYTNAHINLGLAEFKLGHYDIAEQEFNTVKELFPHHPNLSNYFKLLSDHYLMEGVDLALKEKKYDEALIKMQKAASLSPGDAEIYYNMGGVCFTAGNYVMARQMWEKTLQLNPNHQQAQMGMGALPK